MLRSLTKTLIYSGLRLWPDYMLDKAAEGDMWSRIRHLRDQGFDPRQIVDVGAYDGLWALRAASIFPNAHMLMIEPLDAKARRLRAVVSKLERATYCPGLVAEIPGRKVVFHEAETASSMYRGLTVTPETVTEKTTTTLDAILAEHGVDKVDFLKLDIQGAELDALKGGLRGLSTADVVLIELTVDDAYEGAPHAGEIIAFMRDQGFKLCDFADVKRLHRGEPVHQFDGFFIRDGLQVYRRA